MYETLHVWAIEVDQDRTRPNLQAQREFIRDFGRSLYASVDDKSNPLSKLVCPYFTRIFCPERDKMGAYVRLCFFVEEGNYECVERELNSRLEELQSTAKVFQVKRGSKPGIEDEARQKGAERFAEQYYRFMETLGRISVELFAGGVTPQEAEQMVWTWSHNVFNLLRGLPVKVAELRPGDQISQDWLRRLRDL